MQVPDSPKIFHISHVANLSSLVDRSLWSNAERVRQGLSCRLVGMSEIKRRRLEELEVHCHAGTMVGDYVPFYFCPRSVMLYLLHRGNSPGLTYTEGQDPIIHLRADLNAVVTQADQHNRCYAFTKGNAGARQADFFADIGRIGELNWRAISAMDWRDPDVKEGKQAEFLVERGLPWSLVEHIGVKNKAMAARVAVALHSATHRPKLTIEPEWYY